MSEKKRMQMSVSTMEHKLTALKRLESGENVNKIASELNGGRSTLAWLDEMYSTYIQGAAKQPPYYQN